MGEETSFSNVENRNTRWSFARGRGSLGTSKRKEEKKNKRFAFEIPLGELKMKLQRKFSIGIANLNATQEIHNNECRLLRLSLFLLDGRKRDKKGYRHKNEKANDKKELLEFLKMCLMTS